MKRILLPILAIGILLLSACAAPSAPSPAPEPRPAPPPAPTPSPTPITRDELQKFSSEILLRASDCGAIFRKASAKYPSWITPSEGAVCRLVTVISKSNPPPSDPWKGAFLREIIDLYPDATAASQAFDSRKKSASQIMDSDFGVGEQSYQCTPRHTTFRRNNLIVSIVLFGEGSGKEYAKLADIKILNYVRRPSPTKPFRIEDVSLVYEFPCQLVFINNSSQSVFISGIATYYKDRTYHLRWSQGKQVMPGQTFRHQESAQICNPQHPMRAAQVFFRDSRGERYQLNYNSDYYAPDREHP